MHRIFYLALVVLIFNTASIAQSTQDLQAIRSMCGCYKVTFAFAETFSPDTAYEFRDNYQSSALEWVEMVRDEGDFLRAAGGAGRPDQVSGRVCPR